MTDIFVSYASVDTDRVGPLVKALEREGFSVFWDREIPPGQTWADYIGSELEKARCVLVCWSEASVASQYVREEARAGMERKALIPVFLENVKLPWGFGEVQAKDLSAWDGTVDSPTFRKLVAGVKLVFKQQEDAPIDRGTTANKPIVDPAISKRTEPRPWYEHLRAFVREHRAVTLVALVAVLTLGALALRIGSKGGERTEEGSQVKVDVDDKANSLGPPPPDPPSHAETNPSSQFDQSARLADERRGPLAPTWNEDADLNPRILIEGDIFWMGSPKSDEKAHSDEHPQHRVTLSDFYVQRHEVTNREYRRLDPDHERGAPNDHPAASVSWEQARAYAQWLGGDLPTEAQWEFAARSRGKPWIYPWGDQPADCTRAVMDDSGAGGTGCGRNSTWPVCSKTEGNTEQGLCDMAGNVWEWCLDWYNSGEYGRRAELGLAEPVMNPSGPEDGQVRVNRGGAFEGDYGWRSTRRNRSNPRNDSNILGFRVVWPAE